MVDRRDPPVDFYETLQFYRQYVIKYFSVDSGKRGLLEMAHAPITNSILYYTNTIPLFAKSEFTSHLIQRISALSKILTEKLRDIVWQNCKPTRLQIFHGEI